MQLPIIKLYLVTLGIILMAVGLLGFFHIIGPHPEQSPWGGFWYFDTVENSGHTIVGVAALWVAIKESPNIQKLFTLLSALAGTAAGLYSLLIANKILGANFQNPADTLFHLSIGVGGWIAYFITKRHSKLV